MEKNLPVAAGLGGGSADAGAVFRMVAREYGLPDDWPARAAKLGADVPACVRAETCMGIGTGTELVPVETDLTGAPVLLVNPRVQLATGPVFSQWDGVDLGPLPGGSAREVALFGRNDLEWPAVRLCPEIAMILSLLNETGAWLVRMSGSGATCFAIYEGEVQRDLASARVRAANSGYWQMSGKLR